MPEVATLPTPCRTYQVGASNVNAWILTITYGFCFGVELTMTNVAAFYFYEYHGTVSYTHLTLPTTGDV